MMRDLHVLMITSEWPTKAHLAAPFVVRQLRFLRNAGLDVDVFPFRGNKNVLNYMRVWVRLQSKLRASRYDLIHAQFGQSGVLALLPKRLPLVVTFRGSDVLGIVGETQRYTFAGRVLQKASWLVARFADEAIVVSADMIRYLPKRNYHVIPSGIDLGLFRPLEQSSARRVLGLEQGRPIVLFAGDPRVARKRYGLAQSAVKLIESRFPGICLLAVKGVAQEQMPLYMNASDVLLLTSLHEGSPNVVKEALACNLPVVSVDVGDVRERIGAVEGCVVCTADHGEDVAEGLAQAIARGRRVKGRETVKDLDESVLTQKVISIYKLALAQA